MKMMGEVGKDLRDHNEKIVQCIAHLKEQRDELGYLVDKQHEERKKLEMEMERITYKLCLITKSLTQRERAKHNYDKTLAEVEEKYNNLVKTSGDLLVVVQKEYEELDSIINKKTSTEDTQAGDEDNETCCRAKDRTCDCEERKEGKNLKPALKSPQPKIDVEVPIKLEKAEETVSWSESADVMAEEDSPQDRHDAKDDVSIAEEHDYSLHFRKYS